LPAILAFSAPPAVATGSELGCKFRSTSHPSVTPAVVRAVRREFLRRHPGDRIVRLATWRTSITVPPDCIGLYYLGRRASDGTYQDAGVAYYDHGRPVARVVHNTLVALHAAAKVTAVSHVSGTYAFTQTGPDAVGGTETFTGATTFAWTNTYGTARRPISLGLDPSGDVLSGSPDHSEITGVSNYTYTDTSDPTQNFACRVPFDVSGQSYFQWYPAENRTTMRFLERQGYFVAGGPPSGDPFAFQPCQVIEPLDPNPDQDADGLQVDFTRRVAPQVAGDMTRWTPFTGALSLHHHGHSSSYGTSFDQDLAMTGSIDFQLRGVQPVIG
jgi:hypothetical protein